jgi:hypothetical protein
MSIHQQLIKAVTTLRSTAAMHTGTCNGRWQQAAAAWQMNNHAMMLENPLLHIVPPHAHTATQTTEQLAY